VADDRFSGRNGGEGWGSVWTYRYLWRSVGFCGNLWESVGICGNLWRSVEICGDLSGLIFRDILKTGCGAQRLPLPTAISPWQNSVLILPSGWTDCSVANTESACPLLRDLSYKVGLIILHNKDRSVSSPIRTEYSTK